MKCAVLHASAWVIEERLISAALILTKAAQVCLFAPVQLKKTSATSLYESVFKSSQNMVLLRASFLVFFASFLGLTSAACPDLWISLGKSCYKVSSDPMNWHQSQQVVTLFCWKVIFSFILMFVDIGCCSTVPGRGDTSLRSMMKMSRYDKTINLCL